MSHSRNDILSSWWNTSRKDIEKVRKIIGDRKVESISPIRDDICLESYPCKGHGGVKITLKNGEVIEYECSSVSIGCIQKAITGKADAHFRSYTKGFTP